MVVYKVISMYVVYNHGMKKRTKVSDSVHKDFFVRGSWFGNNVRCIGERERDFTL